MEEVIPEMKVKFAEKDRYSYFVALENDEVVGVAGFQNESGTLAGIFVNPENKESGISSTLLEKLEEA